MEKEGKCRLFGMWSTHDFVSSGFSKLRMENSLIKQIAIFSHTHFLLKLLLYNDFEIFLRKNFPLLVQEHYVER